MKDERNRHEDMKYAQATEKTNETNATAEDETTHTDTEADEHEA